MVVRGSLGGNDGPLLEAGMFRGPLGLLEYPLLDVDDMGEYESGLSFVPAP